MLKRDWKNTIRNSLLFHLRFLQTIILGFLVGGIYFGIERNLDSNIPPRYNTDFKTIVGFLFLVNWLSFLISLGPVALSFCLERPLFLKEENSNLYSTMAFFLSKNIVEIPFLVLIPLLLCVILYWLVGLSDTLENFFIFYLGVFLIGMTGNSFGYFAGSITSNLKAIGVIGPIIVLPTFLFSGYYKNREDLPDWSSWIEYLSAMKYTHIILVRN